MGRYKGDRKRYGVRLRPTVIEKIKKTAAARKISQTEFIEYLVQHEAVPKLSHNVVVQQTKVVSQQVQPPSDGTSVLIAHYCEAYKARYGGNPVITGKTAGQAKTLLKSVSLARAKDLVSVYLQLDDEWFCRIKHRFSDFILNLEQLGAALEAGKPLKEMTSLDKWAREKEREDGLRNS